MNKHMYTKVLGFVLEYFNYCPSQSIRVFGKATFDENINAEDAKKYSQSKKVLWLVT